TDLLSKGKEKLSKEETAELDAIRLRGKLRREKVLADPLPKYDGNKEKGRQLFTEKGCLACHSHEATTEAQGAKGKDNYVPAVTSVAQFGPNLSQVAAKLGKKAGDPSSARVWLRQWITDPHVHSPRSRMPVTHLKDEEAADVAAWLLAQTPKDVGAEWKDLAVAEPGEKTLENLARAYLVSALVSKSAIATLFEKAKLAQSLV